MLLISVFFIFIIACEKDDGDLNDNSGNGNIDSTEQRVADSIFLFVEEVMDYWYLWNDNIPDLDFTEFSSPADYLEALIFDSLDRNWSFVEKYEVINSIFNEGEYYGFGFLLGWGPYGNLRVLLVYDNTSAKKAGIKRGTIITKMNGVKAQNIVSFDPFFDDDTKKMNFEIDNNGVIKTVTLEKEIVKMNGIFERKIIEFNSKKVGYLVYDSFLEYTKDELTAALSYFKENLIDELVLDLRYNGGGSLGLAEEIANAVIKNEAVGQVMYRVTHNHDRNNFDTSTYFNPGVMNYNLDRIFILATEFSASASEVLINSLNPHIEVYLIGQKTYGKPVGQYLFTYADWAMAPVTLKLVNADEYGEFYDGLNPTLETWDDITKDFGDTTENMLYQAIHYIQDNTFDLPLARKSLPVPVKLPEVEFKGVNKLFLRM
ncbi:S41 family peptidase [Bacteroidota bacterium]